MQPRLSILLSAKFGYDTVQAALDAWNAQTARADIEILVLCPEHAGPDAAHMSRLEPGQIVVMTGSADLHDMRAIGVQRAGGEYVVLAEDHCLPDPDYAAAILARLVEGWDGVAAALRPGTRESSWSDGSFLIGYGEWMEPVVGLGFGGMRTREWSLPARWLYPLAIPAITFLHWKRACVHFVRAGTRLGLRGNVLAAAAALAVAWAVGEAIGAVLGIDRVAPLLWMTETKPVTRSQVAASDARERRQTAEAFSRDAVA